MSTVQLVTHAIVTMETLHRPDTLDQFAVVGGFDILNVFEETKLSQHLKDSAISSIQTATLAAFIKRIRANPGLKKTIAGRKWHIEKIENLSVHPSLVQMQQYLSNPSLFGPREKHWEKLSDNIQHYLRYGVPINT